MGNRVLRFVFFAAAIFFAAPMFHSPVEARSGDRPPVELCRSALQEEAAKSVPRARSVVELDNADVVSVSRGGKHVRGAAFIRTGQQRQAIDYECRLDLEKGSVPMAFYRPVEGPSGRDTEILLYTNSYATRQYMNLSLPAFRVLGISGTAGGGAPGLVACGGKGRDRVAFRFLSENRWTDLPPALFPVAGIAGDAAQGPLVYGGRGGRQVAWMSLAGANALWRETVPAPFEIRGIAGFVNTGPMVFGGRSGRRLAYMKDYASGIWYETADAPFPVRGISGNLTSGMLIYGGDGRQVAYMKDFRENLWRPVAPSPFTIGGLAGWVGTGPVVSQMNGRRIAAMGSYSQNTWDLSRIAPAPLRIDSICGEFTTGIILFAR